MFRKTAWRNSVSDAVTFHQDQALNTTIFLLKAFGPTGFLLREEGEAGSFKVCLGDPHTCTCPVFTREQEPCKHICWVLLRKFRLPREHEYSFQHGLVDRQILEVLHGLHQTKAHRTENDPPAASRTPSQPVVSREAGSVCRKVIQAQDVCPICQEELLEKKQPVSYCRFGCGNNVHISCMKVWADHQRLSDGEETVKCPLCREDFSSLKLLQEQVKNTAKLFTAAEREKADRHLGVVCHSCRVCPVNGKCFKCTVCSYFYLCEDCSKTSCHPQHPFASRTKRREKWLVVSDDLNHEAMGATSQPTNHSCIPVAADPLPENVLGCLPVVKVRARSRLLDEGQQCRICLSSFSPGQHVRTLPCQHRFHTDCVDGILRKSNSCPLDGYVIYNPWTRRTRERKTTPKLASRLLGDFSQPRKNNLMDLFIPGVALQGRGATVSPSLSSSTTLNTQQLLTERFQGLCVATTEGNRELQRKQTPIPESCSSLNRQSKSARSSKKTATKHSSASPKIREEPQLNLFVGLQRPDLTATVASPARRTRLQPKRKDRVNVKDANNRLELRLTGVVMNTASEGDGDLT